MHTHTDYEYSYLYNTLIAAHAVKAAMNAHIWGEQAARGYCRKRDVPLPLYLLARNLGEEDKRLRVTEFKVKLHLVK